MSFLEHLEVFRWHLVRSVFAVLFFAVIAFIFKGILFDGILLAPKNPDFPTYKMLCYLSQQMGMGDALCMDELPFILMNISMSGQFSTHIMTSIVAGFVVAFPYVFWDLFHRLCMMMKAVLQRELYFFPLFFFYLEYCLVIMWFLLCPFIS